MRFPNRPYFSQRRAWRFLIAILVPCVALLALGGWMIAQERQLETRRRTEERQRRLDHVRQELWSQLETIKLQEVTRAASRVDSADTFHRNRAVVFVGPIQNSALQLPWENHAESRKFRAGLTDGPFAEAVRKAEAQELVAHQYQNAAQHYRAIMGADGEPAQHAYAALLLARTLQKLNRPQESVAEYERVLASSPDLVDEHGVPFALYAAPPLLQAGAKPPEIVQRIRTIVQGERLLPPAALRMARDLADRTGASDLISHLDETIRLRDQAEALQRDFPRVLPMHQNREPLWASYGESSWLVSLTPAVAQFDGLVIAVRATEILQQLDSNAGPIRLAVTSDASGQRLGEGFPGLRVVMPEPSEPKFALRETFLIAALLLALGITLFAGYLLRRDVQRDLRLAELRSQFVSSVTHELKTPLTAIRMFSETLRLDDDMDRQTRQEYLDTILHESERLSRLVDNILEFGKIERGKKTYRFTAVRLDEVVTQAARAAQYPLAQAGFALEIATQPDLPPVSADADALQQAILNLLTNAMKYSGNSRQIALRLDGVNGHARIHVVDQGLGISPEHQERIFESFYRAPTAENQAIPGTGLGLTIVAHIAKAHGGAIKVASQPGNGSAFTLLLPLTGKVTA